MILLVEKGLADRQVGLLTSTRIEGVTAAILAGGLGLRLRSVLPDVPKPMAPVGGKPFLEWLILWLRKAGVHDVVLCTGYGAEMIRAYFGDGTQYGMRIRHSREEQLLDTAGALRLAEPLLESDLCLVLNGDSFLTFPLARLVKFHVVKEARASLVVTAVEDASRYGTVKLAPDGQVTLSERRVILD